MADSGDTKSPATAKSAGDDDVVVVELPAPKGWRKHFTPKKGGTLRRNEISFISPSGELIRNRSQLERYLRKNPGSPELSEFDWGTGDTPRRSTRFSQKEKTKAQETPEEEKLTKPLKKPRLKRTHDEKKDDNDDLDSGATPDVGKSFDSKMKEADGGNKETESEGTSELGATESVMVDDMNKIDANLDYSATPDVGRSVSVDHEVKEAGDKETKGDGTSKLGINESVVDDVNKSGATPGVGRSVDIEMKEAGEDDKETKDEGTPELGANEKSVFIDDVNKSGAILDPGATPDVGRSVDSDMKEADEGDKKAKDEDTSKLGANESVVADDVNKSASVKEADSGATPDVGRSVSVDHEVKEASDKGTKGDDTSELGVNESVVDKVNKTGATPGVGRSVDSEMKEAGEDDRKTKDEGTSEIGANEKSVLIDDVNKSGAILDPGATPDVCISVDSDMKEANEGDKKTKGEDTSELVANDSVVADNVNKSASVKEADSGATPDVGRSVSVDHEVKEAGDKETKGDGTSELGVNESVADDMNRSSASPGVGRSVDCEMKEAGEDDKKTKDEGTSELGANEKCVLIDDVNKSGAVLDPGATPDVGRSVDSDMKEADEGDKKITGEDTSELGANESVVADNVNKSASEGSFAGVSDGQDSDKLKGTKDENLEGKDSVQKEESKIELDKEQEVSPEKEEADGNKHPENLT